MSNVWPLCRWALKLSVESNAAKGLGRAFIAVEIKVVDGADRVHTRALELSLSQFQNLQVLFPFHSPISVLVVLTLFFNVYSSRGLT